MTDLDLEKVKAMARSLMPPGHSVAEVRWGFATSFDDCREFVEILMHVEGDPPRSAAWEERLKAWIRTFHPRLGDPLLIRITEVETSRRRRA
jgi:hypothetical protein